LSAVMAFGFGQDKIFQVQSAVQMSLNEWCPFSLSGTASLVALPSGALLFNCFLHIIT
jgi:hypothetical protein